MGQVTLMAWTPVYRLVQRIPRGRVLTYGAVARMLRLRGGARAAGHAMAVTPRGQGIPWHRVLGESGRILLREPYASLQRRLLEADGVQVIERRIDLSKHLWKPRPAVLKSKKAKLNTRKSRKPQRSIRKRSPKKSDIVL